MKRRLYIVEELPCSGKSTLSAYLAKQLERTERILYIDEGTGDHPADYENHVLVPAGWLSRESRIISLSSFSGEMRDQLLGYKIYDALPWETEKPLMLDKWRQFATRSDPELTYVFNCVFLQNPMCETMMRFGFDEKDSEAYIAQIAGMIAPMKPVIVYLKNDEIADSVRKAAKERPGWLEAVIAYHASGAYGRSIGAEGFEGDIRCLEERQRREWRILSRLPLRSFVLDNPQRDWAKAKRDICMMIDRLKGEETTTNDSA